MTFQFEHAPSFDARGLRRCLISGRGVSAPGLNRQADYWRGRQGEVLIRFTAMHWRFHYRVTQHGGGVVPDAMLGELDQVVEAILLEWMAEAPDDAPDIPSPDEQRELLHQGPGNPRPRI